MPRKKLNIERMTFSLPKKMCDSIRYLAMTQNITTSFVARGLIEKGMQVCNSVYDYLNKEEKKDEC